MNEKTRLLGVKVIKLFAVLNLVFWVLGMIPFFLAYVGVHFLPAPDPFIPIPAWSHWLIGGVIVLPFAALVSFLSFISFSWEDFWLSLTLLFALPFGILMTGFCVNMTLGGLMPMVHTATFGESGSIEYRVTNPIGASSHEEACYAGVEVETHVYGMKNICDFGYANRQTVEKGTRIRVSGKASRAGVFYTSYEIVRD